MNNTIYNVDYLISTRNSKFAGYQSKKGYNGIVKVFVSTISKHTNSFENFKNALIYYTIHERICLERAFNRIKIKGGMCKPCCVENSAIKIYNSLNLGVD